jgi:hypothetical protein
MNDDLNQKISGYKQVNENLKTQLKNFSDKQEGLEQKMSLH